MNQLDNKLVICQIVNFPADTKDNDHSNAPHFRQDSKMHHTCNPCKRHFTVKRNLLRHLSSVHEGKKKEVCQNCLKDFTRRDNLLRHQKKCHQPPRKKKRTQEYPPLLHNDPLECPSDLAASVSEDCRQCYIENWDKIRNRRREGQRVKVYSRRLEEEGSDIGSMLHTVFHAQRNAFKINISFGFIINNVETQEKRYYYPSQNGFIFEQPLVVADEDDLQRVLQRVGEVDWTEYVREKKPNSKWQVALLTNVAFHVYPLVDRPIGRGEGNLPTWLVENRGLDALERDERTGKLYKDNLCYFRCL